MRISYWSSDVCSSDLPAAHRALGLARGEAGPVALAHALFHDRGELAAVVGVAERGLEGELVGQDEGAPADRTSVVSGQRVSVRGDLGGRRVINKKITQDRHLTHFDVSYQQQRT